MNPKEILHANLLDIVFDNRNKSYGAYTLRKFYEGRLMKATGIGLGILLSVSLLVHFTDVNKMEGPAETPWGEVIASIVDLPDEKPVVPEEQPNKPREAVATTHFTTDINIGDHDVTDVPNTEELNTGLIDVVKTDGRQPTPNEDPVKTDIVEPVGIEEPVVAAIQRQPEFPGGKEAWSKFLSKYLTVPEELEAGEKRTVLIRFLVSEDGSITQFGVVQSGGKAFDNEVIRVLKKMPKWNPAIQNGRNISVTFTQPVTFQSTVE